MCSEEGKDGSKGGEVDISAVGGDENVIVPATRFHGQLTSEVRSRGIVEGNSTDKRGTVE